MGVIQLNGVMNMISTKGRYALRAMIDLAQNDHGGYIPLKDIAERQEISRIQALKKAQQIYCRRDTYAHGGNYIFCRLPCRQEV